MSEGVGLSGVGGRRCEVIVEGKPNIWFDGDQWQCDQGTRCLACNVVDLRRLAPDAASWDDAMAASIDALGQWETESLSRPAHPRDHETGASA